MSRRLLATALIAIAAMTATVTAGEAAAAGSPIRVTLTAQSHQPHPSDSPA